jgi:RND family efflux transporter MFP subunit
MARFILVIILLIVAAGAGYFIGQKHAGGGGKEQAEQPATTESSDEDKAVATVTVAKVRSGELSDTLTAYGSVIADPGEVRVLSVQFESRVTRVLVTPGEQVEAYAEVMIVEASPDTKVALEDARNAADAAKRDLQQTQQKFEQHLATNQELSQAQETSRAANLKLQSMLERGVDEPQHLKSPMAGVVNKVAVQEGQIVAAGNPLIEIAAQNKIQVKLGVEPEDASQLKRDQVVKLRQVESSNDQEIEGHIRVIGDRVDPTTRLVDVLVGLPPDTHLILDSFVLGRTTRASASGLIVPRDALIAEEDGFVIFTIQDGQAKEHDVHVGVQTRDEAQITSDDVKEGDLVALTGALQLEDKMPVEIKEASTEPTTEPTTNESKEGEKP